MTPLRATTCLGENTVGTFRLVADRLRARGVDVVFDEELGGAEREAAFRRGDLDLVWACGLLTVEASGNNGMRIVAAPVFAGEETPVYRSVVVVREDSPVETIADTFEGRVAVNEHGSWSGYVGFDSWLRSMDRRLSDYRTVILTGGHRRSALAVAEGVADVASIDHTIHEALRNEPWAAGLRVLATTDDWPAPPFSIRPGAIDAGVLLAAGDAVGIIDHLVPASAGEYAHMIAARRLTR